MVGLQTFCRSKHNHQGSISFQSYMAGGLFGRTLVYILPWMPKFVVGWVARRYVAGKNIDSAVKAMKKLEKQSACSTIDVLGEEIKSLDEAKYFVEEYKK